MAKYIFVKNVLHSGKAFKPGDIVPDEVLAEIKDKHLIAPVPEPAKPVAEPPKAKGKG